MINLRYHIVSLVAVFLALGIGVVMGSTVIDRVTVDTLNNRLEEVRKAVNGMRAENRRIESQLAGVRDFADQARDRIVRGHLRGVPVLVTAVTGIDRKSVEALNQALVGAGATLQGTVWFNPKLRMDNEGDVRVLAAALGTQDTRPETLLDHVLTRLASAATDAPGAPAVDSPLDELAAGGFIAFEAAPSTHAPNAGIDLKSVPVRGTRFVVVSGAGAQVSDDVLALPLTRALVASNARTLAAESGQDTPGGRSVFVGLVRSDGDIASRLSTVDNLESSMGQAAAVLAIEELGVPRTGHFGVGPKSERLLPALPA